MKTRPGLKEWVTANSPKLHKLIFDNDGNIIPEGTVITRPDYADALDIIANDPADFYTSDIVDDMIEAVSTIKWGL